MPVSLASNTPSIKAQRQLGKTSDSLSKTYERLSSGMRINKAADDAAGLAVAESLRADTRVAAAAIRNANDGISVTSIADAALQEVGNILTRMAELAEQSSNGVYTNSQRSALSSEFVALGSEIERIAVTTEFNSVKLLSGSSSVTLQVGFDSASTSQITITAISGTLNSLGLAATNSSAMSYSIIGATTAGAQSAALNALDAVNAAISTLAATRGTLGAAESRLNTAIAYLSVARENFAAAESRIRDADIAQEVAEMTRLQVLQQAGAAVLAQANQQPKIAFQLLQ